MIELLPLAQELDEYDVSPGVLGFFVFAVLGVGVWILLKSMSKHLGKVSFDEEKEQDGQDGSEGGEQSATPASASSSSA